jgi:acyl transferase domain-containing protein
VFNTSSRKSPLLIGSVKPNLGHSEAASALSSIFKVVLALENGVLPATIGLENVNPEIRTEEWNMRIVTEAEPWPSPGLRRASVNSFGYGGANAHAILVSEACCALV